MDEINHGFIIVSVRTARGAIPIEGAMVTITDKTEVISVEFTNSSGMTPRLMVKAPPRALSQVPGSDHPYATYTIRTDKVGYHSVSNIDMIVYAGITSIQPVELIPLPEE
jgi:hypothetical protein